MKQLLSIWLVPSKNDKKYLQEIVNGLAKEYESPVFVPHLTLFGDITIGFEKLKGTVDEVFRDIKPFKIKKTKQNQSKKFFKTVFIEFEPNENLKNLFIRLSEKTDKRSVENFNPHISLVYKTMTEDKKLKIIQKLTIKDEFKIGSVYVIGPKKGAKDFYDISSWRTLYKNEFV